MCMTEPSVLKVTRTDPVPVRPPCRAQVASPAFTVSRAASPAARVKRFATITGGTGGTIEGDARGSPLIVVVSAATVGLGAETLDEADGPSPRACPSEATT